MKPMLTPRDLARAIGVSESAVRRWVDAGHIPVTRTAGRHRRIALEDALRYVRQMRAEVTHPEALGLPHLPLAQGPTEEEALFQALAAGDARQFRGLLVGTYLSGRAVARVFDGSLRGALERLAAQGTRGGRGRAVERRGVDVCVQGLAQLRLLLAPGPEAPLALGASPPGDPTPLPSMLAAATLADAGFREQNLGPEMPLEPLGALALEQRARLVWLAINATNDPKKLVAEIEQLAGRLGAAGTPLLLGGRLVREVVLADRPNLHVVGAYAEMAAYARALRLADASGSQERSR
jgi:excisionase family DNA binding protein